MLAASLHNVHECGERQFLFEHLNLLSPDDLLLLDRGDPCRWLVALLNQRAIQFCMRVDNASLRQTSATHASTSARASRSACAWSATSHPAASSAF